MKRFKYSLESVLNYRENEQDQCRHKLTEAERLVQEQEQELQRVRTAIKKAQNQQVKGSSVEFLVLRERYLSRLRNEEKNHVVRLEQLRKKEEEKRQELLSASREVLKMEKVKSREFRQWEHETRREEQHLLDEAGNTQRFRIANAT